MDDFLTHGLHRTVAHTEYLDTKLHHQHGGSKGEVPDCSIASWIMEVEVLVKMVRGSCNKPFWKT